MVARLVVPRLSLGSSTSAPGREPPSITALRVVFGVGPSADAMPTAGDLRPTYTIEMPIFSVGGLDPDGEHELDAASILALVAQRARRRRWGVRLELDVTQPASSVNGADLVLESEASVGAWAVLGHPTGTTTPGGGRLVRVGTAVATDEAAVRGLSGRYRARLVGDAGEIAERSLSVQLGRFEFEG
jgi:hypothetical protein